ncbi:MAG: hypothetical protein AABZ60_13565 [Planctomycetota bacterium]
MNSGDIVSLLILIVIVGSSLLQSLTKKTPASGSPKSDRSLSEIKKYLEEMAQGGGTQKPGSPNATTSNNPKAKPQYTEPYGVQKKPQTPPKKTAPSQGFEQFLEAMPGTAQGRSGAKTAAKPVMMAASKENPHEMVSQKKNREREARVTHSNASPEEQAKKKSELSSSHESKIFTRFHIPEYLTDIQKAFVLSEILAPPQKKF